MGPNQPETRGDRTYALNIVDVKRIGNSTESAKKVSGMQALCEKSGVYKAIFSNGDQANIIYVSSLVLNLNVIVKWSNRILLYNNV